MTIEQALAWADQTMNERLREARRTGNDHDYDAAMEGCIDILAAEVRRYQAMRCETCKHRYSQPDVPDFYCAKTTFRICRPENLSEAAWLLVATCNDLGGGCLAWEGRDDRT